MSNYTAGAYRAAKVIIGRLSHKDMPDDFWQAETINAAIIIDHYHWQGRPEKMTIIKLKVFNTALESLKEEIDRETFIYYFLGALSTYIPSRIWVSKVEEALQYTTDRRAHRESNRQKNNREGHNVK